VTDDDSLSSYSPTLNPPLSLTPGDLFLRLAEVDDALINYSQWWRPFTACLVDYGRD
jgi:hypothetical protein